MVIKLNNAFVTLATVLSLFSYRNAADVTIVVLDNVLVLGAVELRFETPFRLGLETHVALRRINARSDDGRNHVNEEQDPWYGVTEHPPISRDVKDHEPIVKGCDQDD